MRGFANVGNTCGINTLLQCMYSCNTIKHFLNTIDGKSFTHEMKELMLMYYSEKEGILIPRGIINALTKHMGNIFKAGEPVDVGEIWMFLWNLIADEMGQKDESLNLENEHTDIGMRSEKAFFKDIWQNASLWSIHLQGLTISQIQCPECNTFYHNFEHYINLSIDIPKNDTELIDCLNSYFSLETIDDWHCEKCNKKQVGKKIVRLWRIPRVLVISLKRFDGIQKIDTNINIPDTLDMSPYSIQKKPLYQLKGICLHHGNIHGGHYNALVKNNEEWILCDDNSCIKMDNPIIRRNAYLLFYEVQ